MDGLGAPWIIPVAFVAGMACGAIGMVLAAAIYAASKDG